ncbi:hypothetical protein SUGI_0055990 [Cryptomeria japonica]|nr:hypothetical protein SUGI_0055990 [Cryptomeria japonica]
MALNDTLNNSLAPVGLNSSPSPGVTVTLTPWVQWPRLLPVVWRLFLVNTLQILLLLNVTLLVWLVLRLPPPMLSACSPVPRRPL